MLMVVLCNSCKPADSQSDGGPSTAAQQAALPPALGREDINSLYAQTTQLDVIFYNLPISISQEDEASAKNSVTFIAPKSPAAGASCPAIARLSWIGDGTILREANVHLDSTCAYLVFMDKEKPVAQNAMEPNGQDFFRSIVAQAMQRGNQ